MVGSRAAAHLDRGRPDWTVMDTGLGKGSAGVERSRSCLAVATRYKEEGRVTQEICVGGVVAAPSSLNFSRATWGYAP